MLQDYRYASVPALRVNIPLLATGTNEDIDRIEVLQGPAAAIYGPNSGNSVLHVITKSPLQSAGTTVTVDGGERSLVRASLRDTGIFAGNKLAYKLSGEFLTAKDFEYFDPNEPNAYPTTRAQAFPRSGAASPSRTISVCAKRDKSTGEARLGLSPDGDYAAHHHRRLYILQPRPAKISTNYGAAEARNWTYLNLQERLHHKDFFAQVFYDQSNSGNSDRRNPNGTYFLRTGIPIVEPIEHSWGKRPAGLGSEPTRLVIGGEFGDASWGPKA